MMKATALLKIIQDIVDQKGDVDVLLQADHYGYDYARGAEYTYFDGDESTADCPEEAGEDAKPVIVVYV
jgi:hypothetical protein